MFPEWNRGRCCRMHGCTVVVCDCEEVAKLVARRLVAFPSSDEAPYVSLEVCAEPRRVLDAVVRDARVVHRSTGAAVAYSDRLDELWIDYGERGRAHCRARTMDADITVDPGCVGWQWLATRPLLTVSLLELLKRRSLFGLHAAVTARNDRGVAFIGPSGKGKSTAALACALAGWSFLGDDIVFMRSGVPAVEVLAFPDEIDASEKTIRLFPQLGEPSDWPKLDGYGKHQLASDRICREMASVATSPTALLLLHIPAETMPSRRLRRTRR